MTRRGPLVGLLTLALLLGAGWGGLALYLASECGADVTGLTLSIEQLKVAQRRAAQAGFHRAGAARRIRRAPSTRSDRLQ